VTLSSLFSSPVLSFSRAQPIHSVRKVGFFLGAALIGVAVSERPSSAQNLTLAVFQDSIESLRVEAGIPAISGAIVQNGSIVWARGLGRQDVEGAVTARPDTPYVIGALAQTVGSTLLLRKCVDQGYAEVTDRLVRWIPVYPESNTTIAELLSHTAPDGTFRYDPARLSALTGVFEECAHQRYSRLLAEDVFDRLAMINSVPGQKLAAPTPDDLALFEPARLARYGDILRQLAVPYRVINRRPTRNTDLVPANVDIAQGIVASALDLAQFDLALDAGLLLAPDTRVQVLSQAFSGGKPLPTGLGWFVQAYNGEPIAWQFGVVEGAYSSLMIKVPNRKLTLILLANSDGLSAPFSLNAGDVTTSIFARTFLKTFVP
jgi:CubicO group peptidase (beta-lactamase class C family)